MKTDVTLCYIYAKQRLAIPPLWLIVRVKCSLENDTDF
jgi:hypothetical protein